MANQEKKFELVSKFAPTGDQPQAIESLVDGINDGLRTQVLLGVTGSGKTFTMANIIEKVQRPTLVIAHNKTLAAQLCNEFREFFPNNSVNYFVSYYDYYQPEAYIVSSDTYIEKELSKNDEIDKLRHSATCSLFERKDVIIVASVSCIYGLGEPSEYHKMAISLRPGMNISRDEIIERLVSNQYKRNDIDFVRGTFRVRGDTLEIFPSNNSEYSIRVEFWGDEIEKISEIESVTGRAVSSLEHIAIYPASHYVVGGDKMEECLKEIEKDMETEVQGMLDKGKLIEAERLKQRTSYDIEMLREIGYCNGIENYSRYFDGRKPGETPFTLLDYFPDDFLVIVDESHMTFPQIRAMYNGDRARKDALVEYGFRLKSAYDNRPLKFEEFEHKFHQIVCVSATPGPYEMELQDNIAEQIIRPTGLVDPEIIVKPVTNQVDDLIGELNKTIESGGRCLVTTLTKKMAEELSKYLSEIGIKTTYLHSEIKAMDRITVINELRSGESDVLVGINLLREGLDLPEVKLVAILDADKEGFLRSTGALIQTIGRAARNAEGRVVMYADVMTDSLKRAIDETNRRRAIQQAYNKEHGIVPKTIVKDIVNTLKITNKETDTKDMKAEDIIRQIESLTALMNVAVKSLDFEKAIELRDKIEELKIKSEGKAYLRKNKVEKVRAKVYERTRKSEKVRR
ncbi:MAG: excinuclease ABC subunit UvrB [Clostridia bacterium]|nr:excinuclease ABC subunit UvrB [Clostridia bacterium]